MVFLGLYLNRQPASGWCLAAVVHSKSGKREVVVLCYVPLRPYLPGKVVKYLLSLSLSLSLSLGFFFLSPMPQPMPQPSLARFEACGGHGYPTDTTFPSLEETPKKKLRGFSPRR